jgi:tyrosine phenol-lyase
MDVIAESVQRVHDRRNSITGLTMIYEPKYLRFFQARFERKCAA